jgi:clan AA aspartic protease (TIGR02281 family)
MALLGNSGPTNCPKCGLPWLGSAKCDCGWNPNKGAMYVKIAIGVVVVAAGAAATYIIPRFYDFFPNTAEAETHYSRARDELNRNNITDAIAEYTHAVTLNPRNAEYRRALASAMYDDRRLNEARKVMEKAYELDSKNTEIAEQYTKLLERSGEFGKAAEVEAKLHGEHPKELTDALYLARLYKADKQYDKSEPLLFDLVKQKPQVNGPALALADLYEKKNDRKRATQVLRDFLAYKPGDAFVQQELALRLVENNEKAAAAKELKRAAELDPHYAEKNSELISNITKTKAQEHIVPLKRFGNSWFTTVTLNGGVKANFVVDTGAESVAISSALAQKLKLTPAHGRKIVVQGATGAGEGRAVVLDSVQVGNAKELLVKAIVLPKEADMDGLLGMTFLSRYQATLDTKKNALILKHGS